MSKTRATGPVRVRRVLGYARVSSVEQARGSSLQDQQDAIASYARSRGMNVARCYVEAESAVHEKIERRDQIRALMADMRTGDLVVVDKLDRWSRDPEFTYASVRQIREAGASFYSVSEQCDPSTPDGETMLGFRILFAREEHKRIRERMVGTRQKLRDRGYYVEGLPPFGYRRQDATGERRAERNVLVIEPDEAEVVRRAFRLSIAGKSIAQIAALVDLNRDRVADILRNRVYLGEIRNTRGEWVRGLHEAILDADTFERSRVAREARTLGGPRPAGAEAETGTWILRDVATCLHCGGRMGAAYAGPKGSPARRYYYRCLAMCSARYVRVRDVEAACEPLVVARLAELREELARSVEPAAPRKVDTADRRRKLAARRGRVIETYHAGIIDRAALDVEVAKLDAAVLKLDAEDHRRPSPLESAAVRREVLREVEQLAKAWRASPPHARRAIVNDLCSAVGIAADAEPRPVWRSNEDLAAEVRQ